MSETTPKMAPSRPPEPQEPPTRLPLRGLAYRQARWGLRQILPLLDESHTQAVAQQEAALRAQGRSPHEFLPQIIRNLFEMEEAEEGPFADQHSDLSVMVRRTRQALLTSVWEDAQQPAPITDGAASAPFDPWRRHQQLHAEDVNTISGAINISDTRHDRSQDRQQPAPSLIVQGGTHWDGIV